MRLTGKARGSAMLVDLRIIEGNGKERVIAVSLDHIVKAEDSEGLVTLTLSTGENVVVSAFKDRAEFLAFVNERRASLHRRA
jgi:hypothetical protein